MALTIVETPITGGVDTHADVHVAAALDPVGGLLGVAEFPVTPAGYARLLNDGGEFVAEVPLGEDGGFRFFAAPGTWTVRVLAPGGVSTDETVTADFGHVTALEVNV